VYSLSKRPERWLLLLVFLMGALCASADDSATSVKAVADGVDRRYNSMQSLETSFTESYRGPGVVRQESGTLWLKKPGRMRWEYRDPKPKLFLSDGKTAWFYVPGEPEVRKAAVKNLEDLRSPLRYLLGKTKLLKEFDGLTLDPDEKPMVAGNVVLRGVPKTMADRVSQVLLEITPQYVIQRIVIAEVDGSETEFRFTEQKQNLPIAENRFKFTPPSGVEVVDTPELSQ